MPIARVHSGRGGAALDLPDDGPDRSTAAAHRRAAVGRREPRGYARSLEPLPADIPSRSVSKSAVSRRFVAKTASQLAAWQATPLDELDLVGLLLDGVHIGEHCVVVALGVGFVFHQYSASVGEEGRHRLGSCSPRCR